MSHKGRASSRRLGGYAVMQVHHRRESPAKYSLRGELSCATALLAMSTKVTTIKYPRRSGAAAMRPMVSSGGGKTDHHIDSES